MKQLEFTKSKKLLNIDKNAKTIKGQAYGYMTAILYLAPSDLSGFNVCPMASKGCKSACLNTADILPPLLNISKASFILSSFKLYVKW